MNEGGLWNGFKFFNGIHSARDKTLGHSAKCEVVFRSQTTIGSKELASLHGDDNVPNTTLLWPIAW